MGALQNNAQEKGGAASAQGTRPETATATVLGFGFGAVPDG